MARHSVQWIFRSFSSRSMSCRAPADVLEERVSGHAYTTRSCTIMISERVTRLAELDVDDL